MTKPIDEALRLNALALRRTPDLLAIADQLDAAAREINILNAQLKSGQAIVNRLEKSLEEARQKRGWYATIHKFLAAACTRADLRRPPKPRDVNNWINNVIRERSEWTKE